MKYEFKDAIIESGEKPLSRRAFAELEQKFGPAIAKLEDLQREFGGQLVELKPWHAPVVGELPSAEASWLLTSTLPLPRARPVCKQGSYSSLAFSTSRHSRKPAPKHFVEGYRDPEVLLDPALYVGPKRISSPDHRRCCVCDWCRISPHEFHEKTGLAFLGDYDWYTPVEFVGTELCCAVCQDAIKEAQENDAQPEWRPKYLWADETREIEMHETRAKRAKKARNVAAVIESHEAIERIRSHSQYRYEYWAPPFSELSRRKFPPNSWKVAPETQAHRWQDSLSDDANHIDFDLLGSGDSSRFQYHDRDNPPDERPNIKKIHEESFKGISAKARGKVYKAFKDTDLAGKESEYLKLARKRDTLNRLAERLDLAMGAIEGVKLDIVEILLAKKGGL